LVEVLGFEGDGLALVEELLRPGVREALISDLGGGSRVRQHQILDDRDVADSTFRMDTRLPPTTSTPDRDKAAGRRRGAEGST